MKTVKRSLSIALCLCLAFTLLTGCNGSTQTPATAAGQTTQATQTTISTATTTSSSGPIISAKDSFTFSESNPINSLDPTGANTTLAMYLFGLVFSTLVTQPETGVFEGDLAESYNISPDGLTYTFKVRSDATFHDGTAVTAEDVANSINAMRENAVVSSRYVNVESVTATDDLVTIAMLCRDRSILNVLCSAYTLPMAQFTQLGADGFGTVLNGSGKYRLSSYDNATGNWTVVYNENYYGEVPKIKAINYRPIADVSTRLIALEKGEIDLCQPGETNFSIVEANPNLAFILTSNDVNPHVAFNNAQAPFDSKIFRQAIAYALDYEALGIIRSERGYSYNTQVWSTLYWGNNIPDLGNAPEYNPEKAKELLTQAGISTPYSLGKLLTMSNFQSLTEQMQADLAAVGINCEIESVDPNTWVQRYVSGDYTMTFVSQTFSQDKAQCFTSLFGTDSAGNYTFYSNAEMDSLLDSLKNAATDAEVDAITLEIVQMLNEDVPIVHLFDQSSFYAFNKNLVVTLDGSGSVDYSNIYWIE